MDNARLQTGIRIDQGHKTTKATFRWVSVSWTEVSISSVTFDEYSVSQEQRNTANNATWSICSWLEEMNEGHYIVCT